MEKAQNAIVWAEIPVLNFERAKAFYSAIFDYDMYEEMMGSYRMGFLPMDPESRGAGAAIVQGENYVPSGLGAKVYLNGGNDLTTVLNRVDPAGGKVILPKTKITDEIGYYATFEDTEGNHVCLHSQK
ncbi:VOC family protein [uncultured Sunxiuqinia sp.]|uniref:VOC family protein n=1 Tax=uncultured Sunxiuqinia sp. TaxID=1573825 RepID=UPI0030DA47D8